MKPGFQRFRYAATGRWAVSIRTYLAMVFPFGYLTSIEREQQLHNISVSHAAGIALGGELMCALYLFVAQALLLGNRKNQLQSMLKVVFVWITAGLMRGIFTACNANWGSGYSYNFAQRIPSAALYTTFAMSLTAYYFGTIDRKRIETRALKSLEAVLAQEQSGLSNLQRERRRKAQQVLDGELLPQVSALQSGIEKMLAQSTNQVSVDEALLKNLYDQSRDISGALEEQVKNLGDAANEGTQDLATDQKFSYWSGMLPKFVSIRITFMLMVLGSFSGQFARNGSRGALAGFVGAFVVVGYLLPISQALKKSSFNRPVLYLLAYPGSFAVQALYNKMQPHIGFVLNHPYQPWYSGLKTMYGVYVASIIASLIVSVEGSFTGLSKSGLRLRKKVEDLSVENLSLQQSIAGSQFGTLQGKITGVTMALHLMNSMSEISQERKSELLSGANAQLQDSLREIEILRVGVK